MRTTGYAVVLASFLAVLVVFATAPAMAESNDMGMGNNGMMPNNSMMNQSVPSLQHQSAQTNNAANTGIPGQTGNFSGAAKAGSSNENKAKSSAPMNLKKKADHAAVSEQTHSQANAKANTSKEMNAAKSGTTGQMKSRSQNMAKGMASSKMMSGAQATGKAGVTEHGSARMAKQGKAAETAKVKGGVATVARVDRPGNCLRVRKGPSAKTAEIGCLQKGAQMHLTGVFSRDGRWAQLQNHGWVFYPQIKTSVRPPHMASAGNTWSRAATYGRGFRRGYYRPYSYYYGSPYYYGGNSCGYPGGSFYFPRGGMYWNWGY